LDLKKRFSEEQIIGFLQEAETGLPVKALCRRHGFSEASYYLWRSKLGGMTVSEARRLRELETQNVRLKKLLAESMLELEVTREALREKWCAHRRRIATGNCVAASWHGRTCTVAMVPG
jgi:putative transposase